MLCDLILSEKIVNVAEEGNKVCFISGLEGYASCGCMYERAYF